jgi:hypothetical protein
MAKQSQNIPTDALQPTLDFLDQCLKLKTDASCMHDKDKVLISVSHKEITRVRSFLVQLRVELEQRGISLLLENGSFLMAKGVHRFELRIRERWRRIRTPRRKRVDELDPEYDVTYAWTGVIAVNNRTDTWQEWVESSRRRLEKNVVFLADRINQKFEHSEQRRLEKKAEQDEAHRREQLRIAHRQRMAWEEKRYEFIRDYFGSIERIEQINVMRRKIKIMFTSNSDIHLRKIDKWLESEIRRLRSHISPKAVKAQLVSSGLFDDVRL